MNQQQRIDLSGGSWAQFLGIMYIIMGAFYTLTIIGAIVGVPFIFAGLGLFRGGGHAKEFMATGEQVAFQQTAVELLRHARIMGILLAVIGVLYLVLFILYFVVVVVLFGLMGAASM